MKGWGGLLWAVGAFLVLSAFLYDATVTSYGDATGTYNLGKLQHQMMLMQSGIAMTLIGAFLYIGGSIIDRMPKVETQPANGESVIATLGEPSDAYLG